MLLQSTSTLITADQMRRLDHLFGAALLDDDVRYRLLTQHDDTLLTDYGLSPELQMRLAGIQASTLVELAQALLFSFSRRP